MRDPMNVESSRQSPPQFGWNPRTRTIATLIIVAYLALVIIAPLNNPVGSSDLTRPIAGFIAPLHQALYLNHGYRFFGPDPGPSHLVHFEITGVNGEKVEGHFPDRNQQWPRLLYHRWFMLSERVFLEFNFTPDEASFRESQLELAKTTDQLKVEGHFELSDQVRTRLATEAREYKAARLRIDNLLESIARYLLDKNDGKEIELAIQVRRIPPPLELATGAKLDDPEYLETIRTIARFKRDDRGQVLSVALPTEFDELEGQQ